jgi:hypothetical protein
MPGIPEGNRARGLQGVVRVPANLADPVGELRIHAEALPRCRGSRRRRTRATRTACERARLRDAHQQCLDPLRAERSSACRATFACPFASAPPRLSHPCLPTPSLPGGFEDNGWGDTSPPERERRSCPLGLRNPCGYDLQELWRAQAQLYPAAEWPRLRSSARICGGASGIWELPRSMPRSTRLRPLGRSRRWSQPVWTSC